MREEDSDRIDRWALIDLSLAILGRAGVLLLRKREARKSVADACYKLLLMT